MRPPLLSLLTLTICLAAGATPVRAQVVAGTPDPPGLLRFSARIVPPLRLPALGPGRLGRASLKDALVADSRLLADARLRRSGHFAAVGAERAAETEPSVPAAPAVAPAAGLRDVVEQPREPAPGDPDDVAAAEADSDAGAGTLGVRVTGLADLASAWSRHSPCDPTLYLTCDAGLLPQLRPDVQFGVQAGGSFSERFHLNVDYDQAREFDAANSISIYYQGRADELLQRVEVGDVSIRLPSSRFMTRGIPAGNFGLMATGRIGALDVQAVFAQQKGSVTTREFRLDGIAQAGQAGPAGLEQDAQLVLDDADYVKGQFFFLVEPTLLRGHPHIDVLSLLATDAPAGARPGAGGTIELYRDERAGAFGQGAQLGYFLADAEPPGGGVRHTGSFRRLLPEHDYTVHSSGLWLMLRSPLRPDEALAVSYLTETGDTVGHPGAEAGVRGVTPRLRLLRGPSATHQPGAHTWPMEMRQVYRLDSSSDVDIAGVELSISLGELAGGRSFRDVAGQQLSLLRFFGLDEDSPADRIDAAQLFQPARIGGGNVTGTFGMSDIGDMGNTGGVGNGVGSPIRGTYLVLPTLRPFAEPGPVLRAQLSAHELAAALGSDANHAIYDEPDPVSRASSARFRLNFAYRVRLDGLASSFSLGAFGIRDGSERLYLGSRLLERGIDYTIDYDVGTVMLLDAQRLIGAAADAGIRATWEQKTLFDVAPTSVFGASARYDLGPRGELNFTGLYQAEQSLMTRPQLGLEPGAAFLGGASGRFDLGGALLDRVLGGVPGLRSTTSSTVSVRGEVAFSLPNPNRRGAAYLDDFEAVDEMVLRPRRHDWRLGSAPQSSDGDRGVLPFVIDAGTAAPLVWQHEFLHDGAVAGLVYARNIDRQINVVGAELPEAVMWLTFGRGPGDPSPLPDPGDPRRWRSLTTVLSTTGHDLSRAEHLEFYVDASSHEPLSLIFDVGTVGEDAFYVDPSGSTGGTDEDGRRWGLGVLDEEASLVDREVWGTDADRRGLWDQACMAEPNVVYALGDARANCTRGNGAQDTEDLNGNGVLDVDDGQYFRYVVQLDRLSEYLVRDTAATGTGYRLYRVPLRSGTAVNGANDGTWRFIRHVRLTVAGEPAGARTLSLARMRIIGSRWAKRDVHGIRRGMLDAEPGAVTGEVHVGPVSRLTDGSAYAPPPGVIEQLQDPTAQFGIGAHEINTKSLRVAYSDLETGDRAEVYFRYPQQPRNMVTYREMRLWVLPREGSWGPGGDERFSIRVGTDPRNFYLYQSRLRPATGPRGAHAADWQPELVIDFQQWWTLKAEAERLLIERGPRPFGVDTLWSADSVYALVLEDRARAPNLAAVRELVFAVYNGGGLATTGEIWIDELRVTRADTEPGGAGTIAIDLAGGDFMNATMSLSNQGALFRQLGETARYIGGSDVSFSADARLDRMLPESWGVDVPVTVSHTRDVQTPAFLQHSDVQADRLDGLRRAGSGTTRLGIRLSRRTPLANPLLGVLVDGAALRVGYTTGHSSSLVSRAESSGLTGGLSWRREPVHRGIGIVPGPLGGVLRGIAPAALERSDAFERLLASRLRWSPASLSFSTAYADQLTRSFRYDRILALPTDTAVLPIESPRRGVRNDVQLGVRPFEPLRATLMISSDRDLLASASAADGVLERSALDAARSSLGGVDLGWETSRVMSTTASYRPELARWLRPGWSFSNRYITDRSPAYLQVGADGADSSAIMQRRFGSSRQLMSTLSLQPHGMLLAFGADSAGIAARLAHRLTGIDASWSGARSSQYDRRNFSPAAGYQFGIGGMQSFRAMGGDTASHAQQRDNFSIGTGVLLPGARVDISYHDAETEHFDARGGVRTTHEVGWPKATLQWREIAVPVRLRGVLSSLSTTAGVQRIERTQRFGRGEAQQRSGTELNFPFSLTLGLRRAVTFSYRGSYSTGELLDPTGDSRSGGLQQDVTIAGSVRPPESWRNRIVGPITVTLHVADQQQRQCRYNVFAVTDDGCVAFLDVGTRNANARVETKLNDLDVGLLVNYVARRSHVGMQNGSSQFQLGIYGRFDFEAGRMSAIMPRRQF